MQNVSMRKDNTSGFRGAHFDKGTNKYRASTMVDSFRVSLGCFDSPELAHKARTGDNNAAEISRDDITVIIVQL